MRRFFIITLVILFCGLLSLIFAIKTSNVEFGNEGSYDGKVYMERDENGNLIFKDESLAEPANLSSLLGVNLNHNGLLGLGDDDHTQYLNDTRHNQSHNSDFNNNIPAGPDVNNNITLGDHLSDDAIHPDKQSPQTIVAPWTFQDIYFSGNIYGSGLNLTDVEKIKANIITVAKSGGDFSAVQSAINSITDASENNPYTIILYPGIYNEKITLKNYVSLIGIDRQTCRIISEQVSGDNSPTNSYVVKNTNGTLQNLYIKNTKADYPSVAVYQSGNGKIYNCDLESDHADALNIYAGKIESCRIEGGYDTISASGNCEIRNCEIFNNVSSYVFWTGNNNQTCKIYNTVFKNTTDSGIVNISDDGININLYFYGCKFLKSDDEPAIFVHNGNSGSNTIIYHKDSIYSEKGEDACTFIEIEGGDEKFKTLTAAGKTFLNDDLNIINGDIIHGDRTTAASDEYHRIYAEGESYDNHFRICSVSDEYPIALQWGRVDYEDAALYDTFLYRPASEESSLATNAAFNCKTINIRDGKISSEKINSISGIELYRNDPLPFAGTISAIYFQGNNNASPVEKITYASILASASNITDGSEGSEIEFSTRDSGTSDVRLKVCSSGNTEFKKTRWKDWAACGAAGQNAVGLEIQGDGGTTLEYHTWYPPGRDDVSALYAAEPGIKILFPIDYETGTILTRLRVKYKGGGTGDGVKVRLVKRDESGTNTGWSVVGTQQSYTSANVACAVYDFADETMADNYSYSIEIESEVLSVGVYLYSAGIEAGMRVF